MKPLEIYRKVKELETFDIFELYRQKGISIFHKPELFVHSNTDARIITNIYGRTVVFLNMRSGENPFYEHFLLWHEYGHYLFNEMAIQPQKFTRSEQGKLIEVDSNIFAFFGLSNSAGSIHTAEGGRKHLGIPEDVLETVMTKLTTDQEFVDYMNR